MRRDELGPAAFHPLRSVPMLYFAYGSNMSPRQMQRRCPGARPAGTALALGWRFLITTRGGANIVTAPGHTVEGVLWRVERRHIALLNRWEGVPSGVYRRRVMTVHHGDKTRTAIVYVNARWWPGRARADYVHTAILPGARAFALSERYCDEIVAWLGRRPVGPVGVVYRGRRSRVRHRLAKFKCVKKQRKRP
ncbi:MAG: gamma-glutamylcyclotransferase family protein [Hyphomicrobiaceae bacterium]